MRQNTYFMALGGGQRVGASCYFLQIGGANIILDAGIGKEDGVEFEPNIYSLITSPFIQSMSQINQIFISHAHLDHIGYLLKLMKQATRADVYMTEITNILTQLQLYDRMYLSGHRKDEKARLAAKSLLEKISNVSYMQTINFGKYKVTFYPAGHIPGAMMMLFESGKKKILYTGDYSLKNNSFTNGCLIPNSISVDTLIMCGLHAKHPGYLKKSDTLFKTVNCVLNKVTQKHQSVLCYVPQLSKGIEFLKTLNEWNQDKVPIYIDNSVMKVVLKMEQLSIPIMNKYNKIKGDTIPIEPHIFITSNLSKKRFIPYYNIKKVNFSLHEDFSEMKEFIKKINPKQAILVHCAKEHLFNSHTIEQEMIMDSDCRTQFIFAEEKEIYKI